MKKNEPIGEVACPIRACEKKVPLFKFRARPHEGNRRFAGKLYCRCPDHGQLPLNSNGTELQEYFLNEGKVWGPNESHDAGASAHQTPAPEVTPPQKTPAIPPQNPPAPPATPPATPAPKKPLFSLDW